ncbi:MAG: hypothetical protein N3D17_06355 [bacterium]|nr:hypothetical protein [bacterium]
MRYIIKIGLSLTVSLVVLFLFIRGTFEKIELALYDLRLKNYILKKK